MGEELAYLLGVVATFSGIVPSIVALFRIKNSTFEHRLLAILVLGGTGIGLLAYLLSALGIHNLFLLHFYTIFNFILTSLIFRSVIPQKVVCFLLFSYCIFALVNSVWIEQLQTLNVLNRSLSAFVIMFYPLVFFLKTLQDMNVERLEKSSLFWISIGTLFYNAGSFFIFLFSKDLEPFEALWFTYFGIHAIFTVSLYIFFTIALWVQPKR